MCVSRVFQLELEGVSRFSLYRRQFFGARIGSGIHSAWEEATQTAGVGGLPPCPPGTQTPLTRDSTNSRPYQFPGTTATNDSELGKLGGLKTTGFIPRQVWRPEVRTQGLCSPSAGGSWQFLASLSCWSIAPISASILTGVPPSSYKDAGPWIQGPP